MHTYIWKVTNHSCCRLSFEPQIQRIQCVVVLSRSVVVIYRALIDTDWIFSWNTNPDLSIMNRSSMYVVLSGIRKSPQSLQNLHVSVSCTCLAEYHEIKIQKRKIYTTTKGYRPGSDSPWDEEGIVGLSKEEVKCSN